MSDSKNSQLSGLDPNSKILYESLDPGTYTTYVVDEFLDGEYDYLALDGYHFCSGMTEFNGKEIDDDFYISFYVQEHYHYDESEIFCEEDHHMKVHKIPSVTMTDMKSLNGVIIWYDPSFEKMSFGAIIMETIQDHLDDILSGKRLFLKLKKIFILRAQSSNDRYSHGYGETHDLYITHIEVTGR